MTQFLLRNMVTGLLLNPLLIKFCYDGRIFALFLCCWLVVAVNCISVHKHSKELGQFSAILVDLVHSQ